MIITRVVLQILSQSKNPLAVQTHLRKCFEGIRSVDFVQMSHRHGSLSTPYAGVSQPSTVEIVAILSAEDEKLELLQPVVTTVRSPSLAIGVCDGMCGLLWLCRARLWRSG